MCVRVHMHLCVCVCVLCLPEGLVVGVCVLKAHLLQLAAAVELVVAGVRLLPQVLHVDPDQHLTQPHKITVALVFNCKKKKLILKASVTPFELAAESVPLY